MIFCCRGAKLGSLRLRNLYGCIDLKRIQKRGLGCLSEVCSFSRVCDTLICSHKHPYSRRAQNFCHKSRPLLIKALMLKLAQIHNVLHYPTTPALEDIKIIPMHSIEKGVFSFKGHFSFGNWSQIICWVIKNCRKMDPTGSNRKTFGKFNLFMSAL